MRIIGKPGELEIRDVHELAELAVWPRLEHMAVVEGTSGGGSKSAFTCRLRNSGQATGRVQVAVEGPPGLSLIPVGESAVELAPDESGSVVWELDGPRHSGDRLVLRITAPGVELLEELVLEPQLEGAPSLLAGGSVVERSRPVELTATLRSAGNAIAEGTQLRLAVDGGTLLTPAENRCPPGGPRGHVRATWRCGDVRGGNARRDAGAGARCEVSWSGLSAVRTNRGRDHWSARSLPRSGRHTCAWCSE